MMTTKAAPPMVEKRSHTGLALAVTVLSMSVLALGLYVWHLKHRAEQVRQPTSTNMHVAPPVKGAPEQITLLIADDQEGMLQRQTISAPMPAEPSERAREALHALISFYSSGDSPHALPQGADVNTVYLVGNGLAVVDMNSAFANGHRSGILVEELTIASLAETLAANVPGITRLKFLVDGKERDTLAGHADLKNYYDVAGLNVFVPAGQVPQADASPAAPAQKEAQ